MTEETGSAAVDASALEAGTIQTGAFDVAALGGGGQIAGYRVEAEIGHGGMATVYRALDVKLGRRVALKILAPRLAEDESFRRRFIHESRSAAAVDHPNIVPVFEAGESGGVLFIAMRYVGTGDVRTLLEREGSLPVDRAVAICAQVASALDAASAHGLVHRDVKPANMLLAESAEGRADHVYLSDFGLSKHSLAPSGLTATGQFMGTLDYVAPEQIEGRAVDGRADQYALACAAVEMLTGAPPFRRDENIALMWAQLSESPPSLRERRPDLPEAIDRVIARALAKAPGERYPTCTDFAAALRAAAAAPFAAPGAVRTPTELAPHLPRTNPIDPLGGGAGLDAPAAPVGPPAQWGRAAAPAGAQPGQGGSPSAAPTDLGGRPSGWGQGQGQGDGHSTTLDDSEGGQTDVTGGPAVPGGAQIGLTGLVERPAAWGQGVAGGQGAAGPSSVSEPDAAGAAAGSAVWGQSGPPSISQPGQTGAADRPSAWGQSGPPSISQPGQTGAADRPSAWAQDPRASQPGSSSTSQPAAADRSAAWGQSGPPSISQPGQTGAADRPSAWSQDARESQSPASGASQAGRPEVSRQAAAWGREAQGSPAGSGQGDMPHPATQQAQAGSQEPGAATAGPGARRSAAARQAAQWGREAQPGQPARWGQAARLGQADLPAAPTSGLPPAPSASPGAYRAGSPASPGQSPDSPWSASPWPASAAANPASSLPQTGSPAPWSSPPGGGGLYRPGAPGPADRAVQPDPYRSARVPAPTAPRPKAPKRRRGPGTSLGIAAVIVVLIGLAALGYKLLNHGRASGSAGNGPTATQTITVPPLSAPGVVRAYYAAINQHHYRLAWQLGGKNSGGSLAVYERGFAGTKHDTVRIMGHSGDIVRVKIFARQTDGTRKVYQGFYRVAHGAIVFSHIYRIIFK